MKLIIEILAMMTACAPMASGQSVIALLDGTGSTVTPLWQNNDASAESIAVTAAGVFTLSGGKIQGYDISTGAATLPAVATRASRIGNSDDGFLWGCFADGDAVTVGTVGNDGRIERPVSISPRKLSPEAYLGVRDGEFGPVSVSGDIADGTATVAFVEKVTADDDDGTASLRLWRIYGCFGAAEPEARYSDLCLIDQYPYVTIYPDTDTQVMLTSLTNSITDNAHDAPYFYTSRSATQQVRQKLTAPVAPDPTLIGVHQAQAGGHAWLLYASAPCEVVLARMTDPDRGFDPGNLHYATTLAVPYADMSVVPQPQVHIASAPVGESRLIAIYSAGKALVAYRLAGGNGGVGGIDCGRQEAYTFDRSTIRANVDVAVYDLCGRRIASIPAGGDGTLPNGVYIVRSAGVTRIVSLR